MKQTNEANTGQLENLKKFILKFKEATISRNSDYHKTIQKLRNLSINPPTLKTYPFHL